MREITLTRAIIDGEDSITVVKMKEDEDINATDIFKINAMELGSIGSFGEGVADLIGLTSSQVGALHPCDYMAFSEEVGKYMVPSGILKQK